MARLPDLERTSLGVFSTRDEAESVLDAAIAELAEGKVITGKTLGPYGRAVINRRELDGYRSTRDERNRWKYVEAAEMASWPIREIRRSHILAWARKLRGRGLATQTVRNALNLLRTVFGHALDDQLCDANPCSDVKIRDHGRVDVVKRALTMDELVALFWSASDDGRCLIAVAAGAGLRQGEHRSLLWEDVHLDDEDPYITIRFGKPGKPTKNGRVRSVALFGFGLEAMRWLRARTKRKSRLVWPTSEGHARCQGKIVARPEWVAWLAGAGITRRVRWQDLRHTCATRLLAGEYGGTWTLEEVKEYLGHSSISVTERYARPDGALAAAAVRRHREGTKAPNDVDSARMIAAELLRSRLRDLNSRPTVYENPAFANANAHLDRARAFVVSLLQRAAAIGDVSCAAVELAGHALDELDAAQNVRGDQAASA